VNRFSEKVSFIWGLADLLRGDYKQTEYGNVILPFTLLLRLGGTFDDLAALPPEIRDIFD